MLSRPEREPLIGNVALTSSSSTTPTIREVWRTVQRADDISVSNIRPSAKDAALRRRLQTVNVIGIAYYLLFGTLVFLVGLYVTLPAVYADLVALSRRKAILCFMYANMMLNYVLVILYGDHFCWPKKRPLLPVQNPKNSKTFCKVCEKNIPARAKHCVLCDTCVLKRDHHCFFTGCCVGFFNQRYFVVFCFYAAVCSLFNVLADLEFLRLTYADFFSTDVYKFFLPWFLVKWLFGRLSVETVAVIILTYLTFMTGVACAWFGVQQLVFIYRGQTTYEYFKGVKIYRTFPADHFKSVFGSFWGLNFVFPMPWFKNVGNGRDWNALKHV